jgi:hypothetical protein
MLCGCGGNGIAGAGVRSSAEAEEGSDNEGEEDWRSPSPTFMKASQMRDDQGDKVSCKVDRASLRASFLMFSLP